MEVKPNTSGCKLRSSFTRSFLPSLLAISSYIDPNEGTSSASLLREAPPFFLFRESRLLL